MITVASGSSSSTIACARGVVEQHGAATRTTITGSITTGTPATSSSSASRTAATVSAVPSMPIFTASTPMSVGDRPDLLDDELRRAPGGCRSTPTVFCAVSAVIAVMPCTPQRANAFRSAWMPAPPPESEPAIERTAGGAIRGQVRRSSLPGPVENVRPLTFCQACEPDGVPAR